MSATEDLKEVIKESLESRGTLGQIKARIRAEVHTALTDETEKKPQVCNENVLINELIREYLEFNNYKYAASVLVSESGMNLSPLERDFLKNELNIVEDGPSRSVPLMYSLVSNYSSKNQPKNILRAERNSNSNLIDGGICEEDPVIVRSGRL